MEFKSCHYGSNWVLFVSSFEDGNKASLYYGRSPVKCAVWSAPECKVTESFKRHMHQMLTYTYTPPVQKNTNKWLYATSVSTQQNDCSNNRHYIAQTAGESTQGEKLIMARCSLCATKSRCHAECCQPHSSFKPQNKKACKPFLLFLFLVWVLKAICSLAKNVNLCMRIMYWMLKNVKCFHFTVIK